MENELTRKIIGAAIEVHKALGPGLLESSYSKCLCHEMKLRGIPFAREVVLPLQYKGIEIEKNYVVDILVGGLVPVELKTVDALHPVHEAQLITYMRLGGWHVGLLINFNVEVLIKGVRRKVLNFIE
ncbi:MAG: GxxExxY protein [Pyrinomonadaceae bacterium MAG19_C2-C3]|nr:GxxExxY protein [Pyrinomonadaceae bacterium MAG19_C2-C3]